jgi:hypothetical protein
MRLRLCFIFLNLRVFPQRWPLLCGISNTVTQAISAADIKKELAGEHQWCRTFDNAYCYGSGTYRHSG